MNASRVSGFAFLIIARVVQHGRTEICEESCGKNGLMGYGRGHVSVLLL